MYSLAIILTADSSTDTPSAVLETCRKEGLILRQENVHGTSYTFCPMPLVLHLCVYYIAEGFDCPDGWSHVSHRWQYSVFVQASSHKDSQPPAFRSLCAWPLIRIFCL